MNTHLVGTYVRKQELGEKEEPTKKRKRVGHVAFRLSVVLARIALRNLIVGSAREIVIVTMLLPFSFVWLLAPLD
jgi:hypothetical protein